MKDLNNLVINISVGSTYCTFSSPLSLDGVILVRESLTFKDPLFHIKKKYLPWYNGNICFFKKNKFPTGLLGIVKKAILENTTNCELDIRRNFSFPEIKIQPEEIIKREENNPNYEKRAFQLDCIKKVLDKKRGYFQVGTGGGKTEIARIITECIGEKTLYIVNTKDLLYQTKTMLEEKIKKEIGLIGDSIFDPKEITISTIQTLNQILFGKKTSTDKKNKLLLFLKNIKVLFIDECHHSSSESFYDVCLQIPAPFRYGMSATPLNDDEIKDIKLRALTGKRLYKIDSGELRNQDILCDAFIYFFKVDEVTHDEYKTPVNLKELYKFIPMPDDAKIEIVKNISKKRSGQYKTVYDRGIIKNWNRYEILEDILKHRKNDATLILVSKIKHAKLAEVFLLNSNLYKSGEIIVVTGDTKGIEREEIRKKLNTKEVKVVISTVFGEGTDVPELNTIVNLGGGKSEILTTQRFGRGLRKKEDGSKLLYIDFLDDTHYILKRHSEARMKTISKIGFFPVIINNIKEMRL